MGQSFTHFATDLFQLAHSFLMGQLATLGITSGFAATAILAVVGVAFAWGAFLLVLSVLFGAISRAFGKSGDEQAAAISAAKAARAMRAEPRLTPAPEAPLAPARPGSLKNVTPERMAAPVGGDTMRRPAPAPARAEPSLAAKPQSPSGASATRAPTPPVETGMSAVLENLGFEAPNDGASLSFRKVALDELPHLAPLGRAGFSRPEWTGAVAPASMQDAGAFEVCRFKVRVPAKPSGTRAGEGRQSEQTVDYRVCSLPRVSLAGSRRPDLLVYTTSERGIAPKAAPLGRK